MEDAVVADRTVAADAHEIVVDHIAGGLTAESDGYPCARTSKLLRLLAKNVVAGYHGAISGDARAGVVVHGVAVDDDALGRIGAERVCGNAGAVVVRLVRLNHTAEPTH